MAGVGAEVERCVEIDASGDPLVGLDQGPEVEPLVPGAERVLLDEAVGLVAGQPCLDEGEQHPLREEKPVARLQVRAHPLGEHDEALVAVIARGKSPEEKLAFIKSFGWTESCLYDDFYNPPDKSFYKDGQLVFNLDDSFKMAALANLKKNDPHREDRANERGGGT